MQRISDTVRLGPYWVWFRARWHVWRMNRFSSILAELFLSWDLPAKLVNHSVESIGGMYLQCKNHSTYTASVSPQTRQCSQLRPATYGSQCLSPSSAMMAKGDTVVFGDLVRAAEVRMVDFH